MWGNPSKLLTAISIYVVGSKPHASLQDKTKGEYGILMNNYQQNWQCLVHTAKISDGKPYGWKKYWGFKWMTLHLLCGCRVRLKLWSDNVNWNSCIHTKGLNTAHQQLSVMTKQAVLPWLLSFETNLSEGKGEKGMFTTSLVSLFHMK